MRTVDPIALDALANGKGNPILRVLTWTDLTAYDAAPTVPETMFLCNKFDIYSTSANASLISPDNSYTDSDFTVFIIERGVTVNGTEYPIQSGLYFITSFREVPGRIYIQGSIFPDLKITIADAARSYHNVITDFCTAIGKTAEFSGTTSYLEETQFYPAGKSLIMNKAEYFENVIRQKWTILCYEASPCVITFYSPSLIPTTAYNHVSWSPDLELFIITTNDNTKQGSIRYSYDGNAWESYIGSSQFLKSSCWSPELGLYAIVGTSKAYTSTDGLNWTEQTIAAKNWRSITWSPELGLFVAVQYDTAGDKIVTSNDGTTWTTNAGVAALSYTCIAWSPKLTLFAATTQNNKIITSPDGTNWTSQAVIGIHEGICWSPELGLFVAVGINTVYTSPDGTNWTLQSSTPRVWRSIAWSPELSLFVAVSSNGTDQVFTSPNGVDWTLRQAAAANGWHSITWSPQLSIFVAVSSYGGNDAVMTSPDGVNWTLRVSNNDWNLSYLDGPSFHLTHGIEEVHYFWKDTAETLNTSGDLTKPQWNLGFVDTDVLGSVPTVLSDPYYKFELKCAPVHLNITDGDKLHFESYFQTDPTKVIDALVWVSEHFDSEKAPAWYQIIKSITIFNSVEGGALPSTIERVANYTPLNTSNFEKILSSKDNNLQAAMETIDNHTHDASAITIDSMTDAAAANNTIYYSTTQTKLAYKDSGGTVNVLY